MSEQNERRMIYLLDHHVGTGQMDAAIRETAGHAVAFARLCIILVFLLNAGLFFLAPTTAFAVGAHAAALAALLGFAAMQSEQLARLAEREAAANTAAADYNGRADLRQRAAEQTAHARTCWRAAAIIRVLALISVAIGFISSALGLFIIT